MQTILIANPKGGSGKTTLATNVAGWLAGKRQRVGIEDLDPQQSSTGWLARRPALFPPIALIERGARRKDTKALDLQWRVVDSPAGLHGEELREAVGDGPVITDDRPLPEYFILRRLQNPDAPRLSMKGLRDLLD